MTTAGKSGSSYTGEDIDEASVAACIEAATRLLYEAGERLGSAGVNLVHATGLQSEKEGVYEKRYDTTYSDT